MNATAPPIRGITICVGYDDLLAVTLPRNIWHLEESYVITSPDDHRTRELCASIDRVTCITTDAFYRGGAPFNKGAAMEHGFDVMGRRGWILVLDADILLPAEMDLSEITQGNLYAARRRMLDRFWEFDDRTNWRELPIRNDREFAGYFQLFSAGDQHLRDQPWYGTDWVHAGGCDSVFERRWPKDRKRRLGFEVLHLGPADTNWYGRQTKRLDGELPADARTASARMEALLRSKGWSGRRKTTERVWERLSQSPVTQEGQA